jgi:hypothetical protein
VWVNEYYSGVPSSPTTHFSSLMKDTKDMGSNFNSATKRLCALRPTNSLWTSIFSSIKKGGILITFLAQKKQKLQLYDLKAVRKNIFPENWNSPTSSCTCAFKKVLIYVTPAGCKSFFWGPAKKVFSNLCLSTDFQSFLGHMPLMRMQQFRKGGTSTSDMCPLDWPVFKPEEMQSLCCDPVC